MNRRIGSPIFPQTFKPQKALAHVHRIQAGKLIVLAPTIAPVFGRLTFLSEPKSVRISVVRAAVVIRRAFANGNPVAWIARILPEA
jgi:hypothetical protein